MTEIWLAFVAGLAGSAHCVGMCGGLVAALALRAEPASSRGRMLWQLWYNAGRISTYALLGVTAGVAGATLDLVAVKWLSLVVFCTADLCVIALGIGSLCNIGFFNLSSLERYPLRLLEKVVGASLSTAAPATSLPLGLLLGFLPCGLVYGPLVVAVGSGPVRGASIMIALGVGTAPALLAAGSASMILSQTMRVRMLRVGGLAVALMGIVGLWRALGGMR